MGTIFGLVYKQTKATDTVNIKIGAKLEMKKTRMIKTCKYYRN